MKKLIHKTAIITGAGKGIGRSIALRFAEEGAKVAIWEKDQNAGRQTADEIKNNGGTALFVPCEISFAALLDVNNDSDSRVCPMIMSFKASFPTYAYHQEISCETSICDGFSIISFFIFIISWVNFTIIFIISNFRDRFKQNSQEQIEKH